MNKNDKFRCFENADDDFIEMKTVDSEGKEITVKREEFKTAAKKLRSFADFLYFLACA